MMTVDNGRRVITSNGRIQLPRGWRMIVAEDVSGDELQTRIYPVRYRCGERLIDRLEELARKYL